MLYFLIQVSIVTFTIFMNRKMRIEIEDKGGYFKDERSLGGRGTAKCGQY